jgi:uncharacterized membrane protein YobD (UPF0266 family)
MSMTLLADSATTVSDLYTWQSFATLAGATGATVLVVSVAASVASLSKRTKLVMALIVAVITQLLVAAYADGSSQKWILAAFNALVVYSAAVGVNQQIFNRTGDGGGGAGVAPGDGASGPGNPSWL